MGTTSTRTGWRMALDKLAAFVEAGQDTVEDPAEPAKNSQLHIPDSPS